MSAEGDELTAVAEASVQQCAALVQAAIAAASSRWGSWHSRVLAARKVRVHRSCAQAATRVSRD
ncbi:hypothetical protein GFS60_06573 (plasmid) [Rhodococcus sp. WAY2]|nr:hypothetical protein GFS60_06573 [Rhodococcus sp. WAY2]